MKKEREDRQQEEGQKAGKEKKITSCGINNILYVI